MRTMLIIGVLTSATSGPVVSSTVLQHVPKNKIRVADRSPTSKQIGVAI
jgi:hypothetical protein